MSPNPPDPFKEIEAIKAILYYILSAIGGGIVSEINSPRSINEQKARKIFVRGFTSVVIGIIFGLGTESVFFNVKLSIAISALAGVWGFASLGWLSGQARSFVERRSPQLPSQPPADPPDNLSP